MHRVARIALWIAPPSIAAAIGAACLPDLPAVAAPAVCGDGVIDPDAGEECDPGAAPSDACGACKVQCAGSAVSFVDPATNHCYYSVGTTQFVDTNDGGEPRCEERGGHVVRYVSDDEMALVSSHEPSPQVWVGMKAIAANAYTAIPPSSIEPGWSAKCTGCYAYVEAGAPAIPITGLVDAGGACVVSEGIGAPWVQSSCGVKLASFSRETMCEREPVGTRASLCGASVCFTVAATHASKRYVLLPSAIGSSEASSACASQAGSNATLATFASREEREEVAYEIASQSLAPGVASFWIGLAGGAWDSASSSLDPAAILGEGQNAIDASASRAFVAISAGAIDSSLARYETGGTPHATLCQIAF